MYFILKNCYRYTEFFPTDRPRRLLTVRVLMIDLSQLNWCLPALTRFLLPWMQCYVTQNIAEYAVSCESSAGCQQLRFPCVCKLHVNTSFQRFASVFRFDHNVVQSKLQYTLHSSHLCFVSRVPASIEKTFDTETLHWSVFRWSIWSLQLSLELVWLFVQELVSENLAPLAYLHPSKDMFG